ncbi:energy-coupling factor transporter transmembrane component T family protein [Bacillus taeanensis]|uniref:Energy-coupling factor transporter transmembrane protein EcfT n=1 Tax=Bacillus taeanensis TaxID=273032 RepID=A0A366XPF8_9BACI|nr:energy-coupling factor transporter transmembrane protein EcfT [Bacillus taeanensis]RBW67787.1 cobalt ABC transporter permease [Bacillus taeanensis]
MIQNVIIGQYVPGTSPVHRLDPRAKLIAVFLFVLIVFLANSWLSYGILGSFTLFSILLSQVPLRFLLNGLKPIFIIILFTFILHLIMTKEGPVVYESSFFTIYEEGLVQGAFISFRLLFLILFTSLLTLTTTPIDITDGLESLLSPFKRFGLPVHEFALMMSISLRFIPTLLEETEKIMKAQSARGVAFTGGPLKDRAKAILPLLVPLFISAFKRAEDLALAMEARGYKGGEGRTKLRLLQWGMKDSFLIFFIVVLTVLLVLFRG